MRTAATTPATAVRGVILDRDGVLVRDGGYPVRPADLCWLPGALEALAWLAGRGIAVAVATNQSGVARGYFTLADVHRFHELMARDVERAGGRIVTFAVCPHLPEGAVPPFNVACDCRKPAPGLVRQCLEALALEPAEAILVGDRDRDVAAARAAGVRGLLFPGGNLLAFLEDRLA